MQGHSSRRGKDRERFEAQGGRIRRNIETRARVLRSMRRYFTDHGFLEVETPHLAPAPGMEPHLVPFVTKFAPPSARTRKELFLVSSPEHAMKRLLSSGFTLIYQISRSFRNGELGPLHQPEFTILEWYRVGCDYRTIMEDCEQLIFKTALESKGSTGLSVKGNTVSLNPPWDRVSLRDAVHQRTGIDILACSTDHALWEEAERKGLVSGRKPGGFDDVFFKVFLDHVEPTLGLDRPVILHEYPASMAALARLCPDRPSVAERFEVYIGGIEIANAFTELTDPEEQRRRFEKEKAEKEKACGRAFPMDERFLSALESGLPECAGVALGVDRLVMLLCEAETIDEVMAFPMDMDE